MRTTIDSGGRVVIPKAIRDASGLTAGADVDVQLRDGIIEIAPAPVEMRLVTTGTGVVIQAEQEIPVLSGADVREVLEQTRR